MEVISEKVKRRKSAQAKMIKKCDRDLNLKMVIKKVVVVFKKWAKIKNYDLKKA